MISIVNYGMGNLRSVQNALDFLCLDNVLVNTPEGIAASDKLILPGVGSFHAAMNNLHELGIATAIRDAAAKGTPLLGICLGMQLLAERGEEGGGCGGLGLIKGHVRRIAQDRACLRLPQMGFNNVSVTKDNTLFSGIAENSDFYFANSFHFDCDEEATIAVTNYGETFTSAVMKKNVMGVQFHPEKSQSQGLRLLWNFCGGSVC